MTATFRAPFCCFALLSAIGCGDPFPEIMPQPIDTTPVDTGGPAVPTGDTSFTETTPEPTKPEPVEVEFEIDLDRIQLLTQNCDVFPNGPAADIYYDLRVGGREGDWDLVVLRPISQRIDMLEGDVLDLESDPVRLTLDDSGLEQIILFGQVFDYDGSQENQLIANYDDLSWSLPDEVPTGERIFTRDGPADASDDRRCEIALFATITRLDEGTP